MKGAGCWIMVQEVHPLSDLLLNLDERALQVSERMKTPLPGVANTFWIRYTRYAHAHGGET